MGANGIATAKARRPTPPELVVFAAGLDRRQGAAAMSLLTGLTGPALRRQLYVVDPAEGSPRVKIQHAEALFPDAQLALRNLYAPLPGGVDSDLYRDGFELLCLEALLRRRDLDAYVLMRGAFPLEAVAPWLAVGSGPMLRLGPPEHPIQDHGEDHGEDTPQRDTAAGSPFAAIPRAIAFRAAHPALARIVAFALDLYRTGAVLGLPDYSLDRVLGLAWEASQDIGEDLGARPWPG